MSYVYKGRDITSLVNLMIGEYNDRYGLEAFKDSEVCTRYNWIKNAAIQAAMDISDISEI